jgi:hypothetical protein
MAQETRKTIMVKERLPWREEGKANAAITPGHLIEEMSTGNFRVHATAGGNAARLFALENELEGEGIDDDYAANERVHYTCALPGDIVNAILADGENAAIGSFLESAGDGTLQVHVADSVALSSAEAGSLSVLPEQIVGQAIEALDLSGSSGEESSGIATNPRILIRVI